jgi:hypothetical protein
MGHKNEDGTYTAHIEIDHHGQFLTDEELTITNGSAADVYRLVIRCVEKHGFSFELPDWFPIGVRASGQR